jgi:hypothetical protein
MKNRVQTSNQAAARAGLGSRVKFIEQDLHSKDFQIPQADVFYLYDPFTADTYQRVCNQISAMNGKPIAVVAKDATVENFRKYMNLANWYEPEVVDEGTISIYRSKSGEPK